MRADWHETERNSNTCRYQMAGSERVGCRTIENIDIMETQLAISRL